MIRSVAPTRLSTFYAYLINKIGNRNLKICKTGIMGRYADRLVLLIWNLLHSFPNDSIFSNVSDTNIIQSEFKKVNVLFTYEILFQSIIEFQYSQKRW